MFIGLFFIQGPHYERQHVFFFGGGGGVFLFFFFFFFFFFRLLFGVVFFFFFWGGGGCFYLCCFRFGRAVTKRHRGWRTEQTAGGRGGHMIGRRMERGGKGWEAGRGASDTIGQGRCLLFTETPEGNGAAGVVRQVEGG